MQELLHSSVPGLAAPRTGKVRDVYDLGSEVLIVATDRISAFDAVMENGIPQKGCILNQMSAFWFEKLHDICPNHMISIASADIQSRLPSPVFALNGRSMVAKKARTIPVECVARGYLCGSLFKEYKAQGGNIHGFHLEEGLLDSSRLPEPIFSPATKAEEGHDENISFQKVVDLLGSEVANLLRDWTLQLYAAAAAHAASKGLILADTKFEFGESEEGIILIDEALTPDSSRYWDSSLYSPGKSQPSFDKQFVRDYLETSGWDKTPPGPLLPAGVVSKTREKYVEAFVKIVGKEPDLA
ncbi:MAG: phosphoribosylaminoimidazolesuccinocarboxamide synthase [Armatimonadetes bacterium]|nr:phosphoribosylaminoimidazolesuccinocarboxamide synthase [Armatimonadota bacterium]